MISTRYSGNAIVYCEGFFGSTRGKTAHGLVRRSNRFQILAVVDSKSAGRDAGELLDGVPRGIPIIGSLAKTLESAWLLARRPTHLIVGLAPDGGRLPSGAMEEIGDALEHGLHIISGLHDWLSENSWLTSLADKHGVSIVDVRKPPPRNALHFYTGKIAEVTCPRIAVLGTDSAVGKRTTAWMLADALTTAGFGCELVGTGQTAWLQGARHGIVMDCIMKDFVAGEIEHAVWKAAMEDETDVLVIEGQGSLMHPAYPGGFEILAAARPQAVIMQHAPGRQVYEGFADNALHPLDAQIRAVELVSGVPVVAVTLNHEGLSREQIREECTRIEAETGLPTVDPLFDGIDPVIESLEPFIGNPGRSIANVAPARRSRKVRGPDA